MRPLVIYHGGGCRDGFTAAWVARRALQGEADFLPANYGDDPPNVTGRQVFILDFSYPRDVLLKLAWAAEMMVLLDHHVTAETDLADVVSDGAPATLMVHFDKHACGARLTWNYFYPNEKLPWLIAYVEDRDLGHTFNGTSRLPSSREVNEAIRSYPMEWQVWDRFMEASTDSSIFQNLITEGFVLCRETDKLVEQHCRHARTVILGGYAVPVVNATVHISEIAGKLAENEPFAAVFSVTQEGKVVWNLRSKPTGLDVAAVAKKYGGGGHVHAAGFTTNLMLALELIGG